jgi:hypothetical protein
LWFAVEKEVRSAINHNADRSRDLMSTMMTSQSTMNPKITDALAAYCFTFDGICSYFYRTV